MIRLILMLILSSNLQYNSNRQQDYIVIERDYGGEIVLDEATGERYLRVDGEMAKIEAR